MQSVKPSEVAFVVILAEVGSNELHLLRYIYLSNFLKKSVLLRVVLLHF